MPIFPPAPGFDFQVVDYLTDLSVTTAPATATGIITAVFDQVDDPYYWLVDRIIVVCTSTTATRATVYVGDPNQKRAKDSTRAGNDDVADESSPIVVVTGEQLQVQWTGASVGAVATVNLQVRLAKRTGPVSY